MMTKRIGNQVHFVERSKRKIYALGYDYDSEKFLAKDTLMFSEHITGKSIIEMAYQQAPYNQLWCVSEDGHIALMTKQDEQKTIGWSKIVTDGAFESVAVKTGEPPDTTVIEWDFAFVQVYRPDDVTYYIYFCGYHDGTVTQYLIASYAYDDYTPFNGDDTLVSFGNNIYYAVRENYSDILPDGIVLYTSTDNGETWTREQVADITKTPSIAVDSSGNIYVFWGGTTSDNNFYYKIKTGDTWGDMQTVATPWTGFIPRNVSFDSVDTINVIGEFNDTPTNKRGVAHAQLISGGSWTFVIVDQKTIANGTNYNVPYHTYDSSNNLHLAYQDQITNLTRRPKYAKWNGSSWSLIGYVNTSTTIGTPEGILMDDDNPVVYWSEGTNVHYRRKYSDSAWGDIETIDLDFGATEENQDVVMAKQDDGTVNICTITETEDLQYKWGYKREVSDVWGDATIWDTVEKYETSPIMLNRIKP